MIVAVIDSVTMNSAFTPPKPSRRAGRGPNSPRNPLEEPIRLRKLKLALDVSKGLQSEWERTCGQQAIRAFVIYCEQYDGIHPIQDPVSPGSAAFKQLRFLGFGSDTVDKLILKIALATTDRLIVSDESDFWDPKKPNDRHIRGQKNAPVARYCRENLQVTVWLLRMLIAKLG